MVEKTIDELLLEESPTHSSVCDIVVEAIKARNKEGLSKEDLAKRANVTEQDVDYFERFLFNKVTLEVFTNILKALEIKLKVD